MLPRRAGHPLAVINIIWRGTIIIVPLFILGYCSLDAYRQLNPTFMMTPLDAHVFEHCGRGDWRDSDCNLIPLFFRSGEERDVIVHQLAGYRHSLISSGDNQPVGKAPEQDSTDYFAGPTGFMSFAVGTNSPSTCDLTMRASSKRRWATIVRPVSRPDRCTVTPTPASPSILAAAPRRDACGRGRSVPSHAPQPASCSGRDRAPSPLPRSNARCDAHRARASAA